MCVQRCSPALQLSQTLSQNNKGSEDAPVFPGFNPDYGRNPIGNSARGIPGAVQVCGCAALASVTGTSLETALLTRGSLLSTL